MSLSVSTNMVLVHMQFYLMLHNIYVNCHFLFMFLSFPFFPALFWYNWQTLYVSTLYYVMMLWHLQTLWEDCHDRTNEHCLHFTELSFFCRILQNYCNLCFESPMKILALVSYILSRTTKNAKLTSCLRFTSGLPWKWVLGWRWAPSVKHSFIKTKPNKIHTTAFLTCVCITMSFILHSA